MTFMENNENEFDQIIKIYFRMVDTDTWRARVGLFCGGRRMKAHGNRPIKSPILHLCTFSVTFLVVRIVVE